MPLTLSALAELCDAQISGGDSAVVIASAADIKTADARQVTLINSPKYAKYLHNSKAAACFMTPELASYPAPDGMTRLLCEQPEISFIKAVNLLHPPVDLPGQIAPQAAIADTATLGQAVYIAPFVTIADHARIADGCQIHSGVSIGRRVSIGKNCKLYPNVVIYDDTRIGDDVIVHAGAVLGADGFGYKQQSQRHLKVPHIGNLVIEERVEIGANTCIDRGTFGSTVIGAGSKIDNLVQIGHNNIVGENVIICGQTGISGSCTIENNAILAGSAGIADHVTIGHHAVVMARAGVAGNIEAGAQMFGSPAKDKKTAWKELAALAKLPELLKQIKLIDARLRKLEKN
ncbi:MAG: UDP-3-O-(3-hydroxymyristoyl)glucosamine N-acyltransferase [Gammaproteobacteria bacterium HGW-Gammaproteobacteria-3]|nr:MAG: UDP-3-O-(3-hydroxymyristoyl)glucosamine N-acyltransferase [Gammaproteobacteria bacterium HGW-Gammaproteobacteria-3]